MTTQSLPISKTKKDIIVSAIISILITVASALIVYYSRPGDATHNPGLILRQPRMTFIAAYALSVGAIGFTFLKRPPLGYISRVLAYGFSLVFGIATIATYIFTDEKSKSWGFKISLFALVFTLSAALLTEAMVFYRSKRSQKSRNNIIHQLIFGFVCLMFIGTVSYVYVDKAIGGGAILEYNDIQQPVGNNTNPADLGDNSVVTPLDESGSTIPSLDPINGEITVPATTPTS